MFVIFTFVSRFFLHAFFHVCLNKLATICSVHVLNSFNIFFLFIGHDPSARVRRARFSHSVGGLIRVCHGPGHGFCPFEFLFFHVFCHACFFHDFVFHHFLFHHLFFHVFLCRIFFCRDFVFHVFFFRDLVL